MIEPNGRIDSEDLTLRTLNSQQFSFPRKGTTHPQKVHYLVTPKKFPAQLKRSYFDVNSFNNLEMESPRL